MTLTKVFEPIDIGSVRVPNRIVRTAHATRLGGGVLGEDLIAYHLERAKGGVGLSLLEILSVHPTSLGPLNSFDPTLVESYRRFMDLVRPTGMRVFQQVWHAGHNGHTADGGPPWAPSDVPSPTVGVVPLPMTKGMIDEIVEAFARTAKMCEEGGVEGVEIHCAHGYLVQQFLSPNSNRREDDYGGSLENRMRFLLEVLRAVRAETSPGFVLGIRVAPDLTPGGVDVETNQEVVKRAEAEGLIDFVDISLGSYHSFAKMIGGMHEPVGYEIPTSAPISAVAKTPCIVTGRFRTLEEADQVIRAGEADLVALTRATIADPDLVAKTRSGRAQDVRPCIACNQKCVGGIFGPTGRLGCAVNPSVGFERTLSEKLLSLTANRKSVLVAGGGPAGLEAARVAALRGHNVVLAEATKDLGGALNLAKKAPFRHGIGDIISWLEAQVFSLGVDVRLNTPITDVEVRETRPDVVIVATGSSPRMDGVQVSHPGEPAHGMEQQNVLSSVDVFTSRRNDFGRSAIVVDDLGHYEAIAVAEHLLQKGSAVTYVTRHISFAPLLEGALMPAPALERLSKGDFRLLTRARLLSVGDGVALIAHVYGGAPFEVPAETVVFVSHNAPNTDLAGELEGYAGQVLTIGSARSPRFIEDAIREGHLAARNI